jgi:hypothetical protein
MRESGGSQPGRHHPSGMIPLPGRQLIIEYDHRTETGA